ncbi:MAG: hypothetical protein H8F28_01550 [Fibrella sp.]|nr:hypothetical protein [Armatimonadota bacterium]
MIFTPFLMAILAASTSTEGRTTATPYLSKSPLTFTSRAGAVSVYSRDTNRITCMARGDGATWLGTRQGIKHLDVASGAVRVYGAGEGLPWGAIHSIATDDAGTGAVALVQSNTETGKGLLLFCAYDAESDRWKVLDRVLDERPEWFTNMDRGSRDYFRGYSPKYYIALGERYAILVPHISDANEPLARCYDRATGKVAEPTVAQVISDGDVPFVATWSVTRHRGKIYLGTQYGLHEVDINTGVSQCYLPTLDVRSVAVAPPRTEVAGDMLWFTAKVRPAGTNYSDVWDDGFLQAFSLAEGHPMGDAVSLKGIGGYGSTNNVLRVGEDGFPYVVSGSFARYEPQTRTWRCFDKQGKELSEDEMRRRRRRFSPSVENFIPAPAAVIPDAIVAERAYARGQSLLSEYFVPESVRWIQSRFPDWHSPDARAPSAPTDAAERCELNALAAEVQSWEKRTADPFIGGRAWSTGNAGGVPQVWKWGAPPPAATLYEKYVLETRERGAAGSENDVVTPPEPLSKIPLNLPALRRVQPGVTTLCTVWEQYGDGGGREGVIVESGRGILWVHRLGSDGIAQTRWITPDKQKALESTRQNRFWDVNKFPSDVAALPPPLGSDKPPILRPLLHAGGDAAYYVAVAGSPHLWCYDYAKKTWMQKAALPTSVQRFAAGDGSLLNKLPSATIEYKLLVGGNDGLWMYDDTDNRDRWIQVPLPPKIAPADPSTVGVVAGSEIRLSRAVADKQGVFIAGRGQKNDDPPLLVIWDKQTSRSTFLTEGTHGIPSLRGGAPLLMMDGEAVWYALQTNWQGDASGGYRWDARKRQFVPVTEETVVAMEPDIESGRGVYLLTRGALLHWHRKTGKTTRFALPTEQVAQVMLQTPQNLYIVAQNVLYAWDKKSRNWRQLADIPRVTDDARLQLVTAPGQGKALWLYDGSTAVRVALSAP